MVRFAGMGLSGMEENKKSVGVCIRRRRLYFRCSPQKRAIIGVLNERAVKKIGVEDWGMLEKCKICSNFENWNGMNCHSL